MSSKTHIQNVLLCSLVSLLFLIPVSSMGAENRETQNHINYDPLVDVHVTFTVTNIRSLEVHDELYDITQIIRRLNPPSFYLVVWINDEVFESQVWPDSHVVHTDLSFVANVSNYEEFVSIRVGLFEQNDRGNDRLWDITHRSKPAFAEIEYSIKTGHWTGDDYRGDFSGYGRLNGYDDGNYDKRIRVAEVFFDITQNDYDGDGIPYWTEVNVYGTDPTVDNRGEDYSGDGVPIEWEHRWGYDPFTWDDHLNLDPDEDGLTNYEEYLTSQWGSDPFRKDIFLELDQMELGPNGEGTLIPENSKNLVKKPFHRRNIVFHIDDGSMGGGELIPFQESVSWPGLQQIYKENFLNNDYDNWRRGVFHYSVITYQHDYFHGFAFPSIVDENEPILLDCFQLSTKEHEEIPYEYPLLRILARKSIDNQYYRELIYASAIMHETGHVLGIYHSNTPGCDNQTTKYPWQSGWWIWRNYRSCMNYGYMYTFVDYSDGTHGRNDFDDWGRIDLTLFTKPRYW